MRASGHSVKGRALRYLAQREHSRCELERKLARQVADTPEASASEQIRHALDDLAASGLLSDERAADALVAAKSSRFGDQKLRHSLRERGLTADQVATALLPLADTELARARAVWQRRFDAPAVDAAGRARQARFLAARGFSSATIWRVVQGLDEA
jgi:regulatory protein